jgi:predicted lipoprotein with Yx(FWY)xxD motif
MPDPLRRRLNLKHPRVTAAAFVVALSGAGVGIGLAAGGSSASASPANQATLHTATATVGGKSETILVDGKGRPLYTFATDTPTMSNVKGQLAALWPPLKSGGTPTADGATGRLTVVSTPNGRQVAYNGHFLYTFVDDSPGRVTGQGVQDFFIATPTTGAAASSAPATSSGGSGYGY